MPKKVNRHYLTSYYKGVITGTQLADLTKNCASGNMGVKEVGESWVKC